MAEIVKKPQGQVARATEWDPFRIMRDAPAQVPPQSPRPSVIAAVAVSGA